MAIGILVQEAIEKRKNLERKLAVIMDEEVRSFQDATGLTVNSVHVNLTSYGVIGQDPISIVTGVSIDLKL